MPATGPSPRPPAPGNTWKSKLPAKPKNLHDSVPNHAGSLAVLICLRVSQNAGPTPNSKRPQLPGQRLNPSLGAHGTSFRGAPDFGFLQLRGVGGDPSPYHFSAAHICLDAGRCLFLMNSFVYAFLRQKREPINITTANTIRYQKFSILWPTRQA